MLLQLTPPSRAHTDSRNLICERTFVLDNGDVGDSLGCQALGDVPQGSRGCLKHDSVCAGWEPS